MGRRDDSRSGGRRRRDESRSPARDRRRRDEDDGGKDRDKDKDKDRDRDRDRDRRRRSPSRDRRERRDRSRDRRRRSPSPRGGRGGYRRRSPPLTRSEQRDVDDQIDAFAEQQELDTVAVSALRRAAHQPRGREVLKFMLRMDLRGGTVPTSRLLMRCLSDAQKAVLADQDAKDVCAAFCEQNLLTARIECLLLTLPQRQRELVIAKGPLEDRIRNRGGYVLQLIQQARMDHEEEMIKARQEAEESRRAARRSRSPKKRSPSRSPPKGPREEIGF